MKAGNKIRVPEFMMGHQIGSEDFIVEEFRHCLGIFESDAHREAEKFLPLCELYGLGPESERKYISNFGEYTTNLVQGWSDLPNDKKGE